MESVLTIRTVCKICKNHPEFTGEMKDGAYQHKCPSCGDISYRDKEYPYKKTINSSTYIIFPGEGHEDESE